MVFKWWFAIRRTHRALVVRKLVPTRSGVLSTLSLCALLGACHNKSDALANDWDELFETCNYTPATSVTANGVKLEPESRCVGSITTTPSGAGIIGVLVSFTAGGCGACA